MNEDKIKEAFEKAKNDIFYLGSEISSLKNELIELNSEIKLISNFLEDLKVQQMREKQAKTIIPTDKPTNQHINSNITYTPTDNPTVPQETMGFLRPIDPVSIGNRGVPTDKPTNQQTNQHIPLSSIKIPTDRISQLDRASEILSSLDSLKKEVRFKFKRLTNQEMQVFSMLYSLEEAQESVDYKLLSERLNLSESSIRDYIHKLQKKGIPITKEKFNNKRVILHISPDLKKIASLNTILKLREL